MTHAEARLRGNLAIPRELSYPSEKYENWHNLYDYVSFPAESFRKPFDSAGQSRIVTSYSDFKSKIEQNKKSKNTQIASSYVQNHHSVDNDSLSKPKKYSNKFKNGKTSFKIYNSIRFKLLRNLLL